MLRKTIKKIISCTSGIHVKTGLETVSFTLQLILYYIPAFQSIIQSFQTYERTSFLIRLSQPHVSLCQFEAI